MSIQNVDTQAEARSVVKAQSEKSNSRADGESQLAQLG